MGKSDGDETKSRSKRKRDETKSSSKRARRRKATPPDEYNPTNLALIKIFYFFIHIESIAIFGRNGRAFFLECVGANKRSLWYQIFNGTFDGWIDEILALDKENDPMRRTFEKNNRGGRAKYKEDFSGLFRAIRNYFEHVNDTIQKINNGRKRANKGQPPLPKLSREEMVAVVRRMFPEFFNLLFGMLKLSEEIDELVQHLKV